MSGHDPTPISLPDSPAPNGARFSRLRVQALTRLMAPPITPALRPAFVLDLQSIALRGVVGCLTLQIGVQVVLGFGGDETHATVMHSAGTLGLLLSLGFIGLTRRQSSFRMLWWSEGVSRLLLIPACFLPFAGPESLAWNLALLCSAVSLLSSLGTPLVSTIYGAIYPKLVRGQIVSFGRLVSSLAAIAAMVGLGALFRHLPESVWVVLPVIGALAAVVTWRFCNLRATTPETPATWPMRDMLWVLWRNRDFRNFQLFQFILGFAVLGASPMVQVYAKDPVNGLGLDLDSAVFVVNQGVVAQTATLLSVRLHGWLFDRLGVFWHRTLCSTLMACGFLGYALADRFETAVIAAMLLGLGQAGGQLIWLIGALSFAPKGHENLYNGIHTFLTGVRGVISPVIWLALFRSDLIHGRYSTLFVIVAIMIFISALGHATSSRERELGA